MGDIWRAMKTAEGLKNSFRGSETIGYHGNAGGDVQQVSDRPYSKSNLFFISLNEVVES